MDFEDNDGTRYQLAETVEAPTSAPKPTLWPWVVGGIAVAGGLVWMASASSRSPNPIAPEIEALIAEARDPGTSRDRLWSLLNHPEVEVRRAILDNPNLCPTKANGNLDTLLLEELAEALPEEVATHPLFVLHALIEPNDEMKLVVMKVVQRTEDVGLIEHVLRTWGPSLWWVRQAVALNPKTPKNTLRLLGNQKTEHDKYVRQAVAANPKTPEDTLRTLGNESTESNADVRWVVARNPSTPEDLLHTLGSEQTESNLDVREAAQKALAARGLA